MSNSTMTNDGSSVVERMPHEKEVEGLSHTRTQSYKNIFNIDLLYPKFWAILLADKCHVTIFSQSKG